MYLTKEWQLVKDIFLYYYSFYSQFPLLKAIKCNTKFSLHSFPIAFFHKKDYCSAFNEDNSP